MRATGLPSPLGAAAALLLGVSCLLPTVTGRAAPTVGMTGPAIQPALPAQAPVPPQPVIPGAPGTLPAQPPAQLAPPVPPSAQAEPPVAPPEAAPAAPPGMLPPAVVEGAPEQPGPEVAQTPDPPARVGRLGVVQGAAQFRPATGSEWRPAVPNIPLTSGNAVMTGQGRALLEIPEGRIGLESSSRVEFQRLDDEALALTLAEGQLMLDLRSMTQGETVQVVTPRGTARIDGPGRYLVTAGAQDRPTRIGVHAGAARVMAEGLDQPVKAGEQLVLSGDWPPQPQLMRLGPPEPLMAWMAGFEPRGPLPQVVQGMTGAEDLMRYGQWGAHPEYGQVWYPPVEEGWAPYRDGSWTWSDPWGWNWVDAAPWGFAPFHYGRWFYSGNRWAWAPRPYWTAGMPLYRPYYAPALVSFWGGFNWGFGQGWGRPVAWAPLGPGEWYRPWYRYSQRYGLWANRPYVRNPNGMTGWHGQTLLPNQLMNHRWATAAPANAFANGAPIRRLGQPFAPQMLAGARGFAGQPVVPALHTPGMTLPGAQRLGLAAPPLAGGVQMGLPGGRPPLPPAGGRPAFAAAGMPRVVGPSGITSGGVPPAFGTAPGFGGRGLPPAYNGAGFPGRGVPPPGMGAPGFQGRAMAPFGGGAPGWSGRTLPQGGAGMPNYPGGRMVPPMGAGVPAFGGGGVPPMGSGVPTFGGGYRPMPAPGFGGGGYRPAAPPAFGGGGYRPAPAPSFAPRAPAPGFRPSMPAGGGFAAPRFSAPSAPRMSAPAAPRMSAPSAPRPSGGHFGGGGRRR